MDWMWLLWGPLLALLSVVIAAQTYCWVYGFQRARRAGKGIWEAIGEGAATATGNSYIVHTCAEADLAAKK